MNQEKKLNEHKSHNHVTKTLIKMIYGKWYDARQSDPAFLLKALGLPPLSQCTRHKATKG